MLLSLAPLTVSLAALGFANAQTAPEELSSSLEGYDELSLFRSLLSAAPQALSTSLSGKTSNITVIVPTNDAITAYLNESKVSDVTELNIDDIETFFSYHVLVASLKASDFGDHTVVPTLLQGEEYNNRSAGPQLEQEFGSKATGQVLIATKRTDTSRRTKRQKLSGPTVDVRAGLAQDAEMTAVDGKWGPKNVNTFQIVNKVLIPPRTCSTTIRGQGDKLGALDSSLNKTELYPTLDTTPNVTCLAPSTEAFKKAGNPHQSLSKADLTGALLAHTLKQVTYTSFLEDGMVLGTYNDTTVTVHIKGDDIYFNNAKIIEPNVLTNNGLLHILDAVIGPEDETSSTSTATASKTSADSTSAPASTSTSDSSTKDNAASAFSISYPGAVALAAGLLIF
ncbi:hypothetical protein G7Z17_g2625 [Cylindrodendrum hubeiense]|uniref:FAS1 domain-containing protein n=1 Tax=Cylindrodendrum hubeiense TaxID=595255 RepID=A0A9P5LKV8_9HYPO|nr:hypothetical protein G7Z17_g2625 [Cylindrodendrum hubeiense]